MSVPSRDEFYGVSPQKMKLRPILTASIIGFDRNGLPILEFDDGSVSQLDFIVCDNVIAEIGKRVVVINEILIIGGWTPRTT